MMAFGEGFLDGLLKKGRRNRYRDKRQHRLYSDGFRAGKVKHVRKEETTNRSTARDISS